MPNEKFVAYIDILGFKDMVSNKNRKKAEIKLTSFYRSIYNLWDEMHFASESLDEINGLAYSDSLTIYTESDSIISLEKFLEFIKKLYKISLFEHRIMLRGGLVKGKFNVKDAVGFENLGKNLFFGQAFIDAYELENGKGIKGCRFVVDISIKKILNRYRIQNLYPTKKLKNSNGKILDFLWIDKKELTENNNEKLNNFYELSLENEWSDHYSSTLDLFCWIADIDKYDAIKQKILESSKRIGVPCSTI
jgi:hypothetical protein